MTSARARTLTTLPWIVALVACGGSDGGGALVPPPAGPFSVSGTVNGLISTGLSLDNNGTDPLTISGNGAFTFAQQLPVGRQYNVSIRSQPTSGPAQQCTVANGSGTIGNASVTNVVVTCAPRVARFLYVPNFNSNDVSVFAINAATGSLSAVAGSPFPAGHTPRTAVANRSGTSLYVTNEGSASAPPSLSVYSINTITGALTALAGSPFDLSTPPPPSTLTPMSRPLLHPLGSLLYLTSTAGGTVYGATLDASSGAPTSIPGMPTNLGLGLSAGTFSPSGSVLYLPHDDGVAPGAMLAYSVHPTSGALTPLGPFPTGGDIPVGGTFNAPGTLLFVANAGSGTLAVFRADTANGTLTAAAGSPFNAGGDTIPTGVTLHPSKSFVYTTNSFVYSDPETSTLSGFTFDPATGVLTPIPGSPFTTSGGAATAARIDPSGKFLYVSNHFDHNIKAYAIDQTTGALTNVPGSPFATGLSPSVVEIDPSGKYLYVPNADSHNVSAYSIDTSTGALTLINSVAAGTRPLAVEMVGLQ